MNISLEFNILWETRETEPGNITIKALKGSRAGHISAVTRLEISLKLTIDKDPLTVTRFELSKLIFAADNSREQWEKVSALDEQIRAALRPAQDTTEASSEEEARIAENDLKIGSLIRGLDDFIEAVEEAAEAASIPVQPVNDTQDAPQSSCLKLPKISLSSFSGNYSD